MKVALYARYSSDNQRDASIADQLRICRTHAEKQGWTIVEEYTDHAISGASLMRPGIQALIADAQRGRFQIVLAEAMDRLSRDQEDIAGVFKRMNYASVRIVTLSEGEVSHLHVGLKGTMNALFLKDLAEKTHRGLRGRVEQGKSGGGNAYGYDVVRRLDANGEPIRGDRTINVVEAEVVRRIFRNFAAGLGPRAIAFRLNDEGIPAPGSGAWSFSTITGNRARGTGILNNEMYVGKLVWNRQRFIKDPDTGKRQARMNPETERVIQEVPELRIVDQELWDAVKARQASVSASQDTRDTSSPDHFREKRRPRYLFSGLSKCGCCGGGYSMISGTLLGCSTARNKGTCHNRTNIRREELERRVLNALRQHLMDPDLFAEFCTAFTDEMNRLRMEASADIGAAEAELKRVERDIQRLMDLYLSEAISIATVKERGSKLEARKAELTEFLATAEAPPPLLHPQMAEFYHRQLARLHDMLHSELDEKRQEAAEVIRSLIEAIILTPSDKGLQIDVQGDLAGILTVASDGQTKTPGRFRTGVHDALASQVQMVAGEGNQRYLRLVDREIPRRAA
ncbi:recombinase family protein [Gluconobacter frateurii]|uniref:recombinase family protein n=1 Tax=Gluconobacter frateurii TaxID=38308 RepID=UPI001F05792E|nr:recombinase family protein [Gluconobacter frateurii]UMM07984.1 recombinase family protein [Gluconobacter frateurii]